MHLTNYFYWIKFNIIHIAIIANLKSVCRRRGHLKKRVHL